MSERGLANGQKPNNYVPHITENAQVMGVCISTRVATVIQWPNHQIEYH